jgi:hypothetical protein
MLPLTVGIRDGVVQLVLTQYPRVPKTHHPTLSRVSRVSPRRELSAPATPPHRSRSNDVRLLNPAVEEHTCPKRRS